MSEVLDHRLKALLAEEYAKAGATGIDIEPGQDAKQRAIGAGIKAALRRAYVAGLDDSLKICTETDTLGRAENDLRDYRVHITGEV